MKNYFFPTLLWVLALSNAFAQKTLSPSVKPYSENWSYNAKRLLNHAGFDLPAAAVNKVSSRGDLQLDSTKTFNEYGLNAPSDSTPLFRTTYEYASANNTIEINYQFMGNQWQPINRTTLTKDDQQRIVEALGEAYDWDSQDFVADSRLEIYPHGNSQELVDSFFIYGWNTDEQDWELLLATYNTFDAQDRLAESISTFDYFGGTQILFKDVYSYDGKGDNYLIEHFAVLDGFEFNSGRTDNTFTDHLLLEATSYVSDGIDFFPTERHNYAYTTFGALRLDLNFDWDLSIEDWRLTQWIEHKFDVQQRVASTQTTIVNLDTSDVRELVTYAYIQDENLSLEMNFYWDDDLFDWVLDTKKHYYYKGLVSTPFTPRPALALQVVPNPTADAVRLNLQQEATVQVFSTSGALLQSRLMQPGQVLNVVDLPAGIYQITAQQGNEFYAGKIVKQ